jgi:hypothetical protein
MESGRPERLSFAEKYQKMTSAPYRVFRLNFWKIAQDQHRDLLA